MAIAKARSRISFRFERLRSSRSKHTVFHFLSMLGLRIRRRPFAPVDRVDALFRPGTPKENRTSSLERLLSGCLFCSIRVFVPMMSFFSYLEICRGLFEALERMEKMPVTYLVPIIRNLCNIFTYI